MDDDLPTTRALLIMICTVIVLVVSFAHYSKSDAKRSEELAKQSTVIQVEVIKDNTNNKVINVLASKHLSVHPGVILLTMLFTIFASLWGWLEKPID